MTVQKHYINIILVLQLIRVAASNFENKISCTQLAINKLWWTIDSYKEYDEKVDQYSILKYTGADIETLNFCMLYKRLFFNSNLEEKMTIITVRCNSQGKAYEDWNAMESFVIAMQKLINHNVNYLYSDKLCLTMECIDTAYLHYYDNVNASVKQTVRVHRMFDEMVKYNICAISNAAIKDIIVAGIIWCMREHLNFNNVSHKYNSKTINENKQLIVDNVFSYLQKKSFRNIPNNKFLWTFGGEKSVKNVLKANIERYEDSIGHQYFSDRPDALSKHLKILVFTKYGESFYKLGEKICSNILNDLYDPKNIDLFIQMYGATYEDMMTWIKFNILHKRSLHDRYSCVWNHLSTLPTNSKFIEDFQRYYQCINNIDAAQVTNEIEQALFTEIFCDADTEKITKIFIKGEVNHENIYSICLRLKNAGFAEAFKDHQSIFIDTEKSLTGLELTYAASVYQTMKTNFDECTNYGVTSEANIELITTTLANESMVAEPNQLLIYKRGHSPHTGICRESYTCKNKIQNDLCISMQKYDKSLFDVIMLSECSLRLVNNCLTNNQSVLISFYTITINEICKISYIHIFLHEPKNSKDLVISIIYNMSNANQAGNSQDMTSPNNYIKCLDNVPISFLDNVNSFQLSLQLNCGNIAKIPNVYRLNTIDSIFTERIFELDETRDIGFFIDNVYALYYGTMTERNVCTVTNSRDSASIGSVYSFATSPGIISLANETDLDIADLSNIFSKFVSNRANMQHDINKAVTPDIYMLENKLKVFTTEYTSTSLLLHICQVKEIDFSRFLLINAIRVIANFLKKRENFLLSSNFNVDGAKLETLEKELLTFVVKDICLHINYDIDFLTCYDLGLRKEAYMIELHVKVDNYLENNAVLMECSGMTENTSSDSKSYVGMLAKNTGMKENVTKMIGFILDEFYKLSNKKVINVTTMIIQKAKKEIDIKGQSESMQVDNEDYEDVKHLECNAERPNFQ